MAYYSNRLSYQEVEDLITRISGEKLLSDQKIWQIVVNKAVEISGKWSRANGAEQTRTAHRTHSRYLGTINRRNFTI